MLKYLWIEAEIEDGVDADGRLGKHRGQGQQVVGHLGVCFEPWTFQSFKCFEQTQKI